MKRTSIVDRMKSVVEKKKNQKDIGEELRMVEAKSSKTKCVKLYKNQVELGIEVLDKDRTGANRYKKL